MKRVDRNKVLGDHGGVGANEASLTEVDPEAQFSPTAQASHIPSTIHSQSGHSHLLRALAADQEHLTVETPPQISELPITKAPSGSPHPGQMTASADGTLALGKPSKSQTSCVCPTLSPSPPPQQISSKSTRSSVGFLKKYYCQCISY